MKVNDETLLVHCLTVTSEWGKKHRNDDADSDEDEIDVGESLRWKVNWVDEW